MPGIPGASYVLRTGGQHLDFGQLTLRGPEVVFLADLDYGGPPPPAAPTEGIFFESVTGGGAPLVLDNTTYGCECVRFEEFRNPIIGGPGFVTSSLYFGARQEGGKRGIFSLRNDVIRKVVMEGDPLPLPYSTHTFAEFGDFDVNIWGHIAFEASFQPPLPTGGDTGIFLATLCDDELSCDQLVLNPPQPGSVGMQNTFEVCGTTPRESVHFLFGYRAGSVQVPNCPSVSVEILRPRSVGTSLGSERGVASLRVNVPGKARGRTILFQAVEPLSCRVSNLVTHTF